MIADGEASLLAAARAGDRHAFGRLAESQRPALRLHCYCQPAFGLYGSGATGGSSFRPLAVQVLRIEAGLIAEIVGFIEPSAFGYSGADLFPRFGLPPVA